MNKTTGNGAYFEYWFMDYLVNKKEHWEGIWANNQRQLKYGADIAKKK